MHIVSNLRKHCPLWFVGRDRASNGLTVGQSITGGDAEKTLVAGAPSDLS